MNNELTKEKLAEINAEIQVILTKYGVTLQPTMGISIVALPTEAEIISPLSKEITGNNNEPNPKAI